MNITKRDIDVLTENIGKAVGMLRQNRENAMNEVNEIMPNIVTVMTAFIQTVEGLREAEELNAIVLTRLQNLNNAYSSRDIILLADVLQYEISELLYFYIDIMDNGE